MRYLLLICACLYVSMGYCQSPGTTLLSAIVVDTDSIPIPGVAIINARTCQMVHTDKRGYFQIEIAEDDSIFIYHIAFKRQFANENANGKTIMLEPQINEIKQVDVTDKSIEELKNLQKTVEQIKRVALEKKFEHSNYTESSRMKRFVQQNGSHDKGFKGFFGPTAHLPLEKIIASVAGNEEKRQRKKLTSHYHLVKKKDIEKGK
jgi:hypothetical protein